jgi:hypothetical protein
MLSLCVRYFSKSNRQVIKCFSPLNNVFNIVSSIFSRELSVNTQISNFKSLTPTEIIFLSE